MNAPESDQQSLSEIAQEPPPPEIVRESFPKNTLKSTQPPIVKGVSKNPRVSKNHQLLLGVCQAVHHAKINQVQDISEDLKVHQEAHHAQINHQVEDIRRF